MDPVTFTTVSTTIESSLALFVANILAFLPNLLTGLLILVLGLWVARLLRRLTKHSLEQLKLSEGIERTPVQAFLQNADVKSTIENIIAGAVYWLVVLFVLYTFVSIVGLQTATAILDRVVFYIPRVISAVLILLFGTLLAGLVETLVKGAVRSIDIQSSRVLAKIASYAIVVIAIMASISELGIAQQFINTLFTGLVAAIALAFGLAFGLGSKDIVSNAMSEWYSRLKRDAKE